MSVRRQKPLRQQLLLLWRWLSPRLPTALRRPRWWWWVVLGILLPICLVNLAVAWVGRCAVFPLSPFHLKYKIQALGAYAWHRPRCAFFDDAPLTGAAARARRAGEPPAVRAARGHRAGRVGRAAAPDLVRRRDGADAADSADGARAGRQRSLRPGAGRGRRGPLPAHAVRDLPQHSPRRGRLQRRSGLDRRPPRPAERPDRDLRRPRDARAGVRTPRALRSPASSRVCPRRASRDGVRGLLPRRRARRRLLLPRPAKRREGRGEGPAGSTAWKRCDASRGMPRLPRSR